MSKTSNISIGKIILTVVLAIVMIIAAVATFSSMGLMTTKGFDNLDVLAGAGTESAIKASFWMYLGIAVGLLGCVAVLVMSLIDKGESISKFILIGAGVIALILMFISLGVNSEHIDALKKSMESAEALKSTVEIAYKSARMAYLKEIIVFVINLLIFACVPISCGIKKLLD